MFKTIITKDYDEMSEKAFEVIKELIGEKPNCVLGLATGSSPIGLYERMVADHKTNGTSYKDVTTFNLDEYCDLPKSHPESYYSFMNKNLFSGLDIPSANIHIPEDGADKEAKCQEYNQLMAGCEMDLQVLGIGTNGHIGFNEPGASFDAETNVVTLKESTRQDNARFFDSIDDVPTQAITMGIGTIMKARKILVLASGEKKADAISEMINGPITNEMPASILQNHSDVVVIIDEKAASKL